MLKHLDIYGGSVGFTFKGKAQFNTVYGAICTIVSLLFFVGFIAMKSVDFLMGYDTQLSMIESVIGPDDILDLNALNYRLAI